MKVVSGDYLLTSVKRIGYCLVILLSTSLLSTSLLSMSLLSACSSEKPPLRVGINPWLGNETLHLASELGAFDPSQIRLVQFTSDTEILHAFRNRNLEAATLTLDEAISLLQHDMALHIVLVIDYSMGADALLAAPTIESLGQLKGKRIGVENTAVGALMLDAALVQAQLDIKDIDQVYATVDTHEALFNSGEVDAIVTFEPVKTQLVNTGANILFDSSRIPGRIVDVLVVRSDIADPQKYNIDLLIKGHFNALDFIAQQPKKAAQFMATRLNMSHEELFAALKQIKPLDQTENNKLLNGPNAELRTQAYKLATFMRAKKLLHRNVDIKTLFSNNLTD